MVLLHEYLAFTKKIIFSGWPNFSYLLGVLVCMSGHVLWLCVFFQFYSMYFFTVQNKRCCCCLQFSSQRIARELVTQNIATPLPRPCFSPILFPGASRFSKQSGCASCLYNPQLLAIQSPLLFDRNADEMKKKSCKINILPR